MNTKSRTLKALLACLTRLGDCSETLETLPFMAAVERGTYHSGSLRDAFGSDADELTVGRDLGVSDELSAYRHWKVCHDGEHIGYLFESGPGFAYMDVPEATHTPA